MKGEIHNQNSLRWHGTQRRIGITGGIASGKSSVGKFLKEVKGFPILDADVYAQEALAPDTKLTKTILKKYGDVIRDHLEKEKPTINRSALSKIIFDDLKERIWLEKLIHPVVQERLKQELNKRKQAPVLALIIPLLFEAKMTAFCSEVWVVNCDEAQQFERLMQRDRLTAREAKLKIQAQWPLESKIHFADVVINNKGGLEDWLPEVDKLC